MRYVHEEDRKLAITLLLLFMVMVIGLRDPPASPLQVLNAHPEFGFAVSVTTSPAQ
jgi:hypothetical protein